MTETVQDVMTANPVTCDASTPFIAAAEVMHKKEIGDVIVMDGTTLCGIVTDRDLVVRGIVQGFDPQTTPIGKLCSKKVVTVEPSQPVDVAIDLMRQHAIRRLPVCDGDKVVGVVSLGDLALDQDPRSVLANISGAPPND